MQHSSMEDDYDDCDWYRKNEDGLYCIEVTANRFEDQELQRIARTIQDNTKHTDRLSMSCNKFSVARITALIEALEHNRSVNVLCVFESQINEAVATEICKAIEYTKCRIHTLELMRNQIEDNGAKLLVQALKTNKTITKLSLLGNIYRFKSFAPAIKLNTSIRVLRLHSEHLKSEGCKCLADVLKGHQTIEELHVFETDLTERTVGQLLEVLPTVKSLTTFEFENDEPFDDRACKQLVTLMNSSTLTSLALKVELTSSSAARALKKALMTNTVLKSLKLVSTDFPKGGKAVLKVLQALKVNTTLEHLNIASNEFNSSEWGHKLQRYLQPNSTLKSLNLSYTRLHTCIQPIADIIRCSSSLTDLNLRHNRLEYLVSYVAGALHDNTTLKRLALGYNGDFGISSKAVAYALKTNITLQILDLESNYFEKEVLHALKSNKTITQLNARHIFCGGDSIIGIMKSLLETNTTLWKMDFSENGFSWDEAKQLNKLLELNRKRRASAVQLLMAAQAILLPKDRGIFNALPNELVEMVLRHFQLEFTTAVHTCGKIIALALDRDFLSPSHTDYSRFNKFWDLVLQSNHV